MNISGIGGRSEQAVLQLKQKGDRVKSGDPLELKEKLTAIETGATGLPQESEQERGVVGLLQEGHYRGVADVRLRINFYQRLQLVASEKSDEELKTESRELVVELEGKVQSFSQEYQVEDQVGELLADFSEEAGGLFEGPEGGGGAGSVIGGLRDAFASLFTSLQTILAAGDQEEAAGEIAADAAILEANDSPTAEIAVALDTPPPCGYSGAGELGDGPAEAAGVVRGRDHRAGKSGKRPADPAGSSCSERQWPSIFAFFGNLRKS